MTDGNAVRLALDDYTADPTPRVIYDKALPDYSERLARRSSTKDATVLEGQISARKSRDE
jgi:hypothetical protein